MPILGLTVCIEQGNPCILGSFCSLLATVQQCFIIKLNFQECQRWHRLRFIILKAYEINYIVSSMHIANFPSFPAVQSTNDVVAVVIAVGGRICLPVQKTNPLATCYRNATHSPDYLLCFACFQSSYVFIPRVRKLFFLFTWSPYVACEYYFQLQVSCKLPVKHKISILDFNINLTNQKHLTKI